MRRGRLRRSVLLIAFSLVTSAALAACTDTPTTQPSHPADAPATATADVEVAPATTATPTATPRAATGPSWAEARGDALALLLATSDPAVEATPAPPVLRPLPPTTAYMASGAIAYSSLPSSSNAVRELPARSQVTLVGEIQGENWVVGDQGWVYNDQGWTRTWYQLDDGSYVYRAFVFLPDSTNLPISHNGSGERYVIVDLGSQTAYAMEGSTVVREMPVTTGKDGFDTPTGTFNVLAGGRLENTRMTSRGAGISDPTEQYDVQNVLFTQYFRSGGFALHMNYWQPNGVFGSTPTSHGCVGLELPDAQFLWHFGYTGMRVVVRDSGGATPVAPPEPTAAREPAATPTPSGPPPVEIYATQGGEPGAEAVAAAKTTPGTTCTMRYISTTGSRRDLPELAPQAADALGWIEFKWRIPPDEQPGVASVEVSCPGGATTAEVSVT